MFFAPLKVKLPNMTDWHSSSAFSLFLHFVFELLKGFFLSGLEKVSRWVKCLPLIGELLRYRCMQNQIRQFDFGLLRSNVFGSMRPSSSSRPCKASLGKHRPVIKNYSFAFDAGYNLLCFGSSNNCQ